MAGLNPNSTTVGIAFLACLLAAPALAAPPLPIGTTVVGRDTVNPQRDNKDDAQRCLDALVWPRTEFSVRCDRPDGHAGDLLIRFPSPISTGDAQNDEVALEWYVARDAEKKPIEAPAVVVVHESGSAMAVGRLFARGLRLQGLHAFMIQLPYYGARKTAEKKARSEQLVALMRQAVADVRRARDAVAALPLVDSSRISLQGTSLGGFVAATSASVDNAYHQVFIVLAGGNLYDVIQQGGKDAAKMREELAEAGYRGDKLKALLDPIEPTRIAHRLDPDRTWLYTAQFDTVVPPRNAAILAQAAGLDQSHHVQMLANHYSGAIYLPYLLTQIHGHILGSRR